MKFLQELKADPTVRAWEVELRRLVNGERAYLLAHTGSLAEFVKEVTDSADDRALSETFRDAALRNVVQSWQPTRHEDPPRVARLLNLVAAFTPEPGFQKLMDFLRRWPYGLESPVSESLHARPKDLRVEALVALSAYFPASATLYSAADPAFRAYEYLLREHMLRAEPEYCGYAARRLLEVHVIEPAGPEISELVKERPWALRKVVPYLLSRPSFLRDISHLWVKCSLTSNPKAVEEFTRALAERRASIEVGGEPEYWHELALEAGTRRLPLKFSDADELLYLTRLRWGILANEGEKELDTLPDKYPDKYDGDLSIPAGTFTDPLTNENARPN